MGQGYGEGRQAEPRTSGLVVGWWHVNANNALGCPVLMLRNATGVGRSRNGLLCGFIHGIGNVT